MVDSIQRHFLKRADYFREGPGDPIILDLRDTACSELARYL